MRTAPTASATTTASTGTPPTSTARRIRPRPDATSIGSGSSGFSSRASVLIGAPPRPHVRRGSRVTAHREADRGAVERPVERAADAATGQHDDAVRHGEDLLELGAHPDDGGTTGRRVEQPIGD